MQGGTHRSGTSVWYEDLNPLREEPRHPRPRAQLAEIQKIAQVSSLPVRTVIERLRVAGLRPIPGGGAGDPDGLGRADAISPMKCTTAEWLDVHRQAHAIGMRTTAR